MLRDHQCRRQEWHGTANALPVIWPVPYRLSYQLRRMLKRNLVDGLQKLKFFSVEKNVEKKPCQWACLYLYCSLLLTYLLPFYRLNMLAPVTNEGIQQMDKFMEATVVDSN